MAPCPRHSVWGISWGEAQQQSIYSDPKKQVLPKPVMMSTMSVEMGLHGLFTLVEQQELANSIPDARLVVVESTDGHNGFLLEFEQINQYVILHLCQLLPHLYGLLGKSNNNKALDFALVASIEAKLLKTIICSEAGGSITNS
ncbi:hypothetical protein KEM48_002654 [Puccinia striiformis f. sp. tritici PST-130]|nr:hypothetical protein KEM48_002654 [Puccinia striiformis f. sp. tritici PST-130]